MNTSNVFFLASRREISSSKFSPSSPRDIFASLALSSSRLIALPKSNGDVRPIAIGEVFHRASARAICFHMRNHFARFFAPIQHGVSTSNGSEILIHHIQLLLDRHPDWVVLKTDVRNAFNSISRRAIAERLSANFPSLMPHFRRMYGHSGSLVFATDSEHVILSSEEGVHQGDPLGPFLFAVGIHDLVSRVQAEHPEAVVLAYLDDVFIIGPEILCLIDPGDVMRWASTFAVSLIESTPFCEECLA